MYLCTRLVKSEEGLDDLELVLEIAVGHHVTAGNQAWVPCKSNEWS